eukprot:354196-Chlamydomonas_euryale.AAC.18
MGGFDHKPGVRLGGATRREKTSCVQFGRSAATMDNVHQQQPRHSCEHSSLCTRGHRDELLAEIKAERAARSGTRKQAAAALVIQCHWRGHAGRRAARSAMQSALLAEFRCPVQSALSVLNCPCRC